MFKLVFSIFILKIASISNKAYANEAGSIITWVGHNNNNNTSANASLSPGILLTYITPGRIRRQRSAQYIESTDQFDRQVRDRHQSPQSFQLSPFDSTRSERGSMSQGSTPIVYMFRGVARTASLASLLSTSATHHDHDADDQSWISSTASIFKTKPDILEWNNPIESNIKGLIENNASNSVDSLQVAQKILSDIIVSEFDPMEIVEKKLFEKFNRIIATTIKGVQSMKRLMSKNSSMSCIKYDSRRLLNLVRLSKSHVQKTAAKMQAWKYYFVNLYSNLDTAIMNDSHNINNNSNNNDQIEMSSQDLADYLENGPRALSVNFGKRRSRTTFRLSVDTIETDDFNSSSRDSADTVDSIQTPIIPQTRQFPQSDDHPLSQGNVVKVSKDMKDNSTNITNVNDNETKRTGNANSVFLFSLQFDCVNYMFQRYFHQLMKGLLEYQTFINEIIDSRKEALVEENKHQDFAPKMNKSNYIPLFNITTPTNSSFRFGIAITAPNASTSKLNITTRDRVSKLGIRNIVLENRKTEDLDALIEYYASDAYAKKVLQFGQWIESMYCASKFYDEKEFEANKGNYAQYSMIKQKPNNLTDWVLYVVNTNIEFERQLNNQTIFQNPQLQQLYYQEMSSSSVNITM